MGIAHQLTANVVRRVVMQSHGVHPVPFFRLPLGFGLRELRIDRPVCASIGLFSCVMRNSLRCRAERAAVASISKLLGEVVD